MADVEVADIKRLECEGMAFARRLRANMYAGYEDWLEHYWNKKELEEIKRKEQ